MGMDLPQCKKMDDRNTSAYGRKEWKIFCHFSKISIYKQEVRKQLKLQNQFQEEEGEPKYPCSKRLYQDR